MTQIIESFSLSHAQVLDGQTSFLDAVAAAAADDEDVYGVNDASMDPDLGDYDNEGDDDILSTWFWINYADVSVQAGYMSLPLIARLTNQTIDSIDPVAAVNEVQTITSSATGGTYTLTFNGETTADIAANASAMNVQTALEGLNNIDTGDVAVAGTGSDRTVTFQGRYAATNVSLLVVDDSLATGGTVTVAQTTQGAPAGARALGLDLWHEDSMNVAPKPMLTRMPAKDSNGDPCTAVFGLYRVQFRPITFDGPAYKDGLKVNYAGRAIKSAVDELGNPFSDGKKRVGRILAVFPA